MDKKKIFIIGGAIAVLGIGFYMWNKSKNTTTDSSGVAEGTASGSETTADAPATKSADAPADSTATAKAPLTTRKEKKKACGRKPLLGKKLKEWKQCVAEGGIASFEGYSDGFQNEYLDFSGLDLDLN